MASPPKGDTMTSRLKVLTATCAGVAALAATMIADTSPLYIWNASPSVPIGLYRLQSAEEFYVTELVAVQPPEPAGCCTL